ncbi:MAG TPA: hypothetical protein VI072_23740 [Polyangiaceae bacterium]
MSVRAPPLGLALCAALCCWLIGLDARAQITVTSGKLRLEATPMLGANTPASEGWLSCAVRVHNLGDAPIAGNLELTSELSWSKEHGKNITRAPFNVPGRASVLLELPTHGFSEAAPTIKVRALAADDTELATLELPDLRGADPFLFDLSVPSRLVPTLRGTPIAVELSSRHSRAEFGAPLLAVGSPQVNPATGALVLPDRAASYASVSVVVAKALDLALLSARQMEALSGWVLAGGTLALVFTRPEDLRQPTVKTLIGGEVQRGPAPVELKRPALFLIPPDATKTPSAAPSSPGYGVGPGYQRKKLRPSDDLVGELAGFSGGNLRPSLWGASASYGLGEIHTLAFDLTREPFVSSEWVKLKMADLVRHAHHRQATLVLPHGQTPLNALQLDSIRRQIDPNENTRWTIAVSALLLLIYAVLAGPLNFYLAARQSKPLRALLHLPVYAAVTMLIIVVLGILGKGVEGRARRLTLVEAGAGMTRATATRFRGLFASSASELSVRASDSSSVLDVAGAADDTFRVLTVERDFARLEALRAKPWQTVVVREDGFLSLGGGVSLIDSGGDLQITNRTARDLVGVLVKAPGQDVAYFRRIRDGESVRFGSGEKLASSIGKSTVGAGASEHTFDAALFSGRLSEHVQGLGEAWQAFESYASGGVDWWPSDVPVLFAQLEGGEGKLSDSGLRVDVDRVLVRVIGYGGVP